MLQYMYGFDLNDREHILRELKINNPKSSVCIKVANDLAMMRSVFAKVYSMPQSWHQEIALPQPSNALNEIVFELFRKELAEGGYNVSIRYNPDPFANE